MKVFDNSDKFTMKYTKKFISDLFKYKLFYKIVDTILLDEDYLLLNGLEMNENTRNNIIKQILKNFKELYNELGGTLKNKINEIIINNLDFIKYFDLKELYLNCYYYYELSPFYNIFQIFHSLKTKINKKGFLNNLKHNFGIYIEVDDFIKQINHKIIKTKFNNIYFKLIEKKMKIYLNDIIILQSIQKKNYHGNFLLFYTKILKKKKNNLRIINDQNIKIIMDNIRNYKDEIVTSIRYNRSYKKLKEKFSEDNNLVKKHKNVQKNINKKEYPIKNINIFRNKYKRNYR